LQLWAKPLFLYGSALGFPGDPDCLSTGWYTQFLVPPSSG